MIPEKTYFHEDFQLPMPVRNLAEKIEMATGQRIQFVFSVSAFQKLAGSDCSASAVCWVSETQAALVFPKPDVSARTIYHELLHIKLAWLDRTPKLHRKSGAPMGILDGYANDLEHLLIIPQERVVFDGPSDRAHWVTQYGDPRRCLHTAPSLQRQRMLMGWLMARELLGSENTHAWKTSLEEKGLFRPAEAFADEVVAAAPRMDHMWMPLFEAFGLRQPDCCWKQIDPVHKKIQLFALDQQDRSSPDPLA